MKKWKQLKSTKKGKSVKELSIPQIFIWVIFWQKTLLWESGWLILKININIINQIKMQELDFKYDESRQQKPS